MKKISWYIKKYACLFLLLVFVQNVTATAYTPHENNGRRMTASGVSAVEGITCAADYIGGYKIPFGTIIEFPDGQRFIVQDRFGAGHNNRLDVFMESYNRAIQFGRRCFDIKVIIPD